MVKLRPDSVQTSMAVAGPCRWAVQRRRGSRRLGQEQLWARTIQPYSLPRSSRDGGT